MKKLLLTGFLSSAITPALVIGLAAIPRMAVAQQSGGIEEIVVMSRRRAESMQDVPAAVSAFSEATIESARMEQVADVVLLVPGATLREQFSPSFTNLTVRGFTTQQNGELPVALSIDGVTVPSPNFLNQDLLDVVQVEVLKGPQGGLYGRNAIAGAINIATRRPDDTAAGRLRVSAGNGGYAQVAGTVSGPLVEDRLFAKLGGSYKRSDGLIKSKIGNQELDFVEEFTAYTRVIFEPSDRLSLDLRGKYTESEIGGAYFAVVPVEDIDVFNRDNDPVIDTPAANDRTLYEITGKVDYDIDFASFTSITNIFDVEDAFFGESDFGVFSPPETLQDVVTSWRGWSQEFRLASPDEQKLRWIVGAFYQDREQKTFIDLLEDLGNGNTAPFFFIEDSTNQSDSWAIFGQAAYDVSDNLELSVALRYDEDKRSTRDVAQLNETLSDTFSELQPKITISYAFDDDITLYATWGRGFRSGGFNGFLAPPQFRKFNNEISETTELGVKTRLASDTMQLNASIYRIEFEGQQFFSFVDPFTSLIVNADETVITGAELEVSMQLHERWNLIANFGFTDGEITKNAPDAFGDTFVGNTSPGTNRFTLNLGAQYTQPLGNSGSDWVTRIDYDKRGPIYYEFNNFHRTSEKNIVNVRTAINTENWTIAAFVRNLTNERYPLTAESFLGPEVVFRLPNKPRTYGVEATYQF